MYYSKKVIEMGVQKFVTSKGVHSDQCLDNILMVLLISALAKIGATKPIFLDSGSPRGVVRVWAWFVIIV